MAENLDTPSFEFGIQNTMEMGLGSPELLNDLMSPETSTTDVDSLEPIVKDIPPVVLPKDDKTTKGKDQKPEGDELTGQDILNNFLQDNGNDTDVDDDTTPPPANDDNNDGSDADDLPPSQFALLSKDLLKLGVFTKDDDEEDVVINTPEEFLERFNAEKKKGAIEVVNNFLGQFGEDYQNAFEAIFVKGVHPKEYFGTYNQIVDFASLDMSVEENQIAVIRQSLTDQEMEPDDIATEIQRLQNYGDLEAVAAKHHKVLVKRGAAKLQQMEQKAQRDLEQKQAIKNQYIQNVQQVLQEKLKTKEFDGIPLNPKLVNELQDFLLVDKYKTTTGETLTDFDKAVLELKRPENHAQKVKVALLLKILEKDPTLSTIQRSGVTKKSDQLFGELARQTSLTKNPKAQGNSKPSSWFQQ